MNKLFKNRNTKYRVVSICIILLVGMLLCAPLYSQEEDGNRGIRIVIPLDIGYQLSFENLAVSGVIFDVLTRLELGAAVGVMFPIGDVVSIGPEVGVRAPLIPLFLGSAIFHIPIRAVVHFAFTDDIGLDAYVAGKFHTWNAPAASHANITFDVGARLDLVGFLIGVEYALPFAVPIEASRGIVVSDNFWQNSLLFSLGYKIKIDL